MGELTAQDEALEAIASAEEPEDVDILSEALALAREKIARRKGLCPDCDGPRQPNEKRCGFCQAKRDVCVHCATDDARRTEFLCEPCIRKDKKRHCLYCLRPCVDGGPVCAVDRYAIEKEKVAGTAFSPSGEGPRPYTQAEIDSIMAGTRSPETPVR